MRYSARPKAKGSEARRQTDGGAAMYLDLWTKIVLTAIALSLVVIAWKLPITGSSHAQGGVCTGFNPCYVSTAGDDYLNVKLVNR